MCIYNITVYMRMFVILRCLFCVASFTIACTTILVDLCIGNATHLRLIVCVVAVLCLCVGLVDKQVSVDGICDVIPLLRSLHQAVSATKQGSLSLVQRFQVIR